MPFPNLDPVAVNLGFFQIHWYGLAYLASFILGTLVGIHRGKTLSPKWNKDQVVDFAYYMVVGVIVGGRLGYILFYNPGYFLAAPHKIFYLWEGGMAFHGGLLGVTAATIVYAKHYQRLYLDVFDFVAIIAPIGLFLGRVANFVNQELWGKVTDVPWGIVFTVSDAGGVPRHPTQLYEALLEGMLLFIILYLYSSKKRPSGSTAALFLIGYAVFRIGIEFFRLPDAHLGYIMLDWVTMGQMLSLAMLIGGIGLLYFSIKSPAKS